MPLIKLSSLLWAISATCLASKTKKNVIVAQLAQAFLSNPLCSALLACVHLCVSSLLCGISVSYL